MRLTRGLVLLCPAFSSRWGKASQSDLDLGIMEPSLGVLLAGFGTVLFNGHPIISEVRRPVEGGRSRFRPKPSRAARTSRRLAAPAAASRLRLLGPLPHCPRFPFAPPPSPHEERLLAANATHVE